MLNNFSNPKENIKHLYLKEGDIVADFGSGAGHYIDLIVNKIGNSGKLYLIDIQKDLLLKIYNDSLNKGFKNVETIWADLEMPLSTKLKNESVNAVLISNLLFQIENKENLIKELYRILKKEGKVLVIDWSDSFGGIGPKPEKVFDSILTKKIFSQHNFSFVEDFNAGAHHFGIVFSKK